MVRGRARETVEQATDKGSTAEGLGGPSPTHYHRWLHTSMMSRCLETVRYMSVGAVAEDVSEQPRLSHGS